MGRDAPPLSDEKALEDYHSSSVGTKGIVARNGGGDPDTERDSADVRNPEIVPLCLQTKLQQATSARSNRR